MIDSSDYAQHRRRLAVTRRPTAKPTSEPSFTPSSMEPTGTPTLDPTTDAPSFEPTFVPSPYPTDAPSFEPTISPTPYPTDAPSFDPTISPSNSPTRKPTRSPTLPPVKKNSPTLKPSATVSPQPTTSLPTSIPTESPTNHLTLLPTVEPTLNPTTNLPTSEPTGLPTDHPTSLPTVEPTISLPTSEPTGSPTDHPTLLPTSESTPTSKPSYKRAARLRYQPTIEPTVQVEPTLKPTRPKKIVKTKKRIERIYKTHEYFLRNSEAGEQIRSFIEIDSPNIDEINDLRGALNEYKNTLGKDKVWLFLNIDHILQIAENYYLNQQLGSSELNKQFSDNNQGLNHVVSVSGALGAGNITNIINYDNKDITGIIGNKKLAGITLVNVTSASKVGSISAYFTSFSTALSNALGKSYLNQNKLITIKECDAYNNLGDIIYSNINTTSITSSINGFLACSNWVANHNEYILTNRGADDCVTMIGDTAALAKCCSFLGLYGLDEEL